jgi:signal transduction histidine kinase
VKLSRFNHILLETLLLPVVALLCVSGVLVWQILRAERTVARMQIAGQNIANANLISALIMDQETGVRGYQNTADDSFLEPYTLAGAPLRGDLQALRAGVASQQHGDLSSVDALEQAHQRWLDDFAVPMIDTVRSGGETRDPATNLRGKASMDNIRSLEAAILRVQDAQRRSLAQHWRQEVDHTLEATIALALGAGLLIGLFARSRLHLVSDAFQATIEEQRRTQAALLASEKLAVTGRLAASIAHEIHNPLDAVVNLLYLMQHGATPAERDEFVDMAQAELSRVTQISRAMLGMYRESRTPVAVDVAEMVRSVLLLLDHRITQAGLSVYTQFASGAIATGYPAELRQVFTNLLTNAIEASTFGGRLDIRVSRQSSNRSSEARDGVVPPAGPGVSVSIADHGCGIAPEDKLRLFQPFFTTKGEQGTGLGLWISHGIVAKHAGNISVETRTATGAEPDAHGTTMTVYLPRDEARPIAAT